jgi:pyridoxine 4-dehydrogenase
MQTYSLGNHTVGRVGFRPMQLPLRRQIEENLVALDTDRLSAVNLRLFTLDGGDAPAQVEARDLFDRQLDAIITARDEGLIDGIGLSNISLEHLRVALERTEIACVPNAYNLVNRSAQPLLDACTADNPVLANPVI